MPELKNTDRLPEAARRHVCEYCLKLLEVHGHDIESLVVYGSAAGVNFVPGVSDINIAAVFYTLDFPALRKSLGIVSSGRRQKIPAPLFLTRDYIQDSLDVFPIEFAEIKEHHVLVYGADVFGGLPIDAKHIKLLCKAQVRGKLLRVRQAYLESGGKPRTVRRIMADSLNTLMPVFRQLVRAMGADPAVSKPEILKQVSARLFLDADVFQAIYEDKSRVASLQHARLDEHFKKYLQQLQQLAIRIDRL